MALEFVAAAGVGTFVGAIVGDIVGYEVGAGVFVCTDVRRTNTPVAELTLITPSRADWQLLRCVCVNVGSVKPPICSEAITRKDSIVGAPVGAEVFEAAAAAEELTNWAAVVGSAVGAHVYAVG